MVASVSNTPYGIIADAMRSAGLLQEGEEPNSEQLSVNLRRLCDIINLWQTQGLKLFLLEDLSITLTAGQNLYTLGVAGTVSMTKPLRVLQGYILQTTGSSRRPLNALSWNEWMTLSQVDDNEGMISSYFVDKQTSLLRVYFWNTPDSSEAENTAHLLIQNQATNPVDLTDTMSFPQEWRIALVWGLADEICTGQPQAIMDRCSKKAAMYRMMLEDWDVEDTATRFVVDSRMNTGGGRFK